jgi:hypothetical protein
MTLIRAPSNKPKKLDQINKIFGEFKGLFINKIQYIQSYSNEIQIMYS